MNWRPLGHIYKTDRYGQCPTPLVMQDRVRVYFSERNESNRSFIRFVDLDLDDPTHIIADDEEQAVLFAGKPGTFDDEGAIPSFAEFLMPHTVRLWYSGWNSRNTIPYHNATGYAISDNGGRTFQRVSDGPVLDRTEDEPYLRVTPCLCEGQMWYVSGLRWEPIDGRYEPIYVIRKRDGETNSIAIPQDYERECFSRPWVVMPFGEPRQMWYCYRNAIDYRDGKNAYRIGRAYWSAWSEAWIRDDKREVIPRTPGFDDTMQCYPAVFDVKGKRYMLYNGNTFGKHGFALAIAE